MIPHEAQLRRNYDSGEREHVIRRLLKRRKKTKKASDEVMEDHVLPRAPVDENKDLSGGYMERLKKLQKLQASMSNLRKVLAQHHDDLGDDEVFEKPDFHDQEYVRNMQESAEHAKGMQWQIPKHQKALERGLIDTFTYIDRVVTIMGPQIMAVYSKIPTVKDMSKETTDKALEHIALEQSQIVSLVQEFEKAILPAAQAIVARHAAKG